LLGEEVSHLFVVVVKEQVFIVLSLFQHLLHFLALTLDCITLIIIFKEKVIFCF
jgi:hypothetical protein